MPLALKFKFPLNNVYQSKWKEAKQNAKKKLTTKSQIMET